MSLQRYFAAALLLAAPLFVFAADPLAGARTLLAPEPVTQGEFVQTRTLAGIRKPLVSNGRFVVARGLGVLWEDLAPFARTMRLTQGEILQTADGQTLMRLSADREPVVGIITGILFGVLAGDLDALAHSFDAAGEVEDTRWRLEFTPKDAHLARLIRALVLRGARDVERVEIISAVGDTTRIEFRAISHAREIPADVRKRFE
ncbi:MAG: outer membrane lipoprotein carrier protein LolA [Candidatus Accumulibacter sp.]|nr:outer membrane lipoprotein carrier protein LolA [Accumulibacter sp.]